MTKLQRTVSNVWHRAAAKALYRPTRIDLAGHGSVQFVPWRDHRGMFQGYVSRECATAESIVVFFHGKDGEALDGGWFAPIASPRQILVLAEYPGYGARDGAPSEEAILGAALDIVEAIRIRWDLPIIVAGESLGASVACYAASRCAPVRVALVSPFSAISDIVAHYLPFFRHSLSLRDNFPSRDYIHLIKAPLHAVHGTDDRMVPIALSHRLLALYQGSTKQLTEIHRAGHVSVRQSILESEAAAGFRRFVREP